MQPQLLDDRPVDECAAAREIARDALSNVDLHRVATALDEKGYDEKTCFAMVAGTTERPESLQPLRALRARLALEGGDGAFERTVLLRAWLTSLGHVPNLPITDGVKRLFYDEVRFVAAPGTRAMHRFDLERSVFVALSKLATLRRFPAGQLHWEITGFPRSWLLKVRPPALPRVAWTLAVKMRGFAPAFNMHLNANRKDRAALLERESNRSYFRMAQSMGLQPDIKGLIASSWLHSPDTMAVSPHLTALNRVFLENGAIVTTMGPADPESGVFTRSPERRQLYESGVFRPTDGLVIWPRAEMLAWAAAHPEYAD